MSSGPADAIGASPSATMANVAGSMNNSLASPMAQAAIDPASVGIMGQIKNSLGDFSNALLHGSAAPTQQQQMMAAVQNNQLKQMDPSDPLYASMKSSMADNLHPDNGGYLGMLGRSVTGSGQTTGEQALGLGLQGGLALYRQMMQRQALQNSNANMQNAGNNMLANQKQQLGGGIF